jgi:hypothetical protein
MWMLFLLENACGYRNYYFYRLNKAYHESLALVSTLVSLFLGRFFASPHFESISESVVVVGDPEHDLGVLLDIELLAPNSLAISTSLSPAAPAVIEHDPSEMKTPNARYRRW